MAQYNNRLALESKMTLNAKVKADDIIVLWLRAGLAKVYYYADGLREPYEDITLLAARAFELPFTPSGALAKHYALIMCILETCNSIGLNGNLAYGWIGDENSQLERSPWKRRGNEVSSGGDSAGPVDLLSLFSEADDGDAS